LIKWSSKEFWQKRENSNVGQFFDFVKNLYFWIFEKSIISKTFDSGSIMLLE